jgi:DNA-directed RNA polymerase subunit RPC12/RpoP
MSKKASAEWRCPYCGIENLAPRKRGPHISHCPKKPPPELDDENLWVRRTNRTNATTDLVKGLVANNKSTKEIRASLMLSADALSYHLKKLGIVYAEYKLRFEKPRERCPHCGRPMD